MRRPCKQLSDIDREIWAGYVAQLQPLKNAAVVPVAAIQATPKQPIQRLRAAVTYRRSSTLDWLDVGQPPAGLDRTTWRNFRTGRHPVNRRLDLHGLTAQRAFSRFEQFVSQSAAQGLRCVEVVTGRGDGEVGGILRRELPLWANLPHLRPLLLAATHPNTANDGAVRLLLRRPPRSI